MPRSACTILFRLSLIYLVHQLHNLPHISIYRHPVHKRVLRSDFTISSREILYFLISSQPCEDMIQMWWFYGINKLLKLLYIYIYFVLFLHLECLEQIKQQFYVETKKRTELTRKQNAVYFGSIRGQWYF